MTKKTLIEEILEKAETLFAMDFCNDGKYTDEEMIECLSGVIKGQNKRIKSFLCQAIKRVEDKAIQEGYERGRIKCLEQGGCVGEVENERQKWIEEIKKFYEKRSVLIDPKELEARKQAWNSCFEAGYCGQ